MTKFSKFSKILIGFVISIIPLLGVLFLSGSNMPALQKTENLNAEAVELPEGYLQAEYIVNPGQTQWIDTGVQACLGDRLHITLKQHSAAFNNSNKKIFGVNESTFKFYIHSNNESLNENTYQLIKSSTSAATAYTIFAGYNYNMARLEEPRIMKTIQEISKSKIINDGIERATSFTYDETKTSQYTYYLYALNNSGQCQVTDAIFQIYDYKIFDNAGNLKQELVPAFEMSTKEAGFYDTVGNKFFKSQGSDPFYCDLNDCLIKKDIDVNVVSCTELYNKYLETNTISLEGLGTQDTPYFIHNIYELIDVYVKGDGKYISLQNDIVLNDGRFEGDKYIDGGDKTLYCWDVIQRSKTKIYGNNHAISNFYSNVWGLSCSNVYDLSIDAHVFCYTSNVKLFGYMDYNGETRGGAAPHEAKNVVATGTLLTYGARASVFGSGNFTNCISHVNVSSLNGLQYSQTMVTMILNGTAKNCVNYGNMLATKRDALGIGATTAINCQNYGDVTGCTYAMGIGAAKAENCTNYGNITSTTAENINGRAGAAGISLTAGRKVNCENYGTIISSYDRASSFGIGGGTDDSYGCANYGKVISKGVAAGIYNASRITDSINYGDIVGGAYGGAGIAAGKGNGNHVTIANCANYGNVIGSAGIYSSANGYSGYTLVVKNCINRGQIQGSHSAGIVGNIYSEAGTMTVTISECRNEGEIIGSNTSGGILSGITCSYTAYTNYAIIRCENAGKLSGNKNGAAIGIIQNTAHKPLTISIVDFLNTGEMEKGKNLENGLVGDKSYYCSYALDELNYIFNCKVKDEIYKYAYGENFDNYFWSWKRGKLGLKCLGGTGFIQGKIDKDFLTDKGFTVVSPQIG